MLDGCMDIAPACILDPAGAADAFGGGEFDLGFHQSLDLGLGCIAELEAVGAEQLDAIISEQIVAGRDHHAQIGAHFAGEQSNGGRGQRAGHDHVHAHTGKPGHQRAFHHVTRQTRVLADNHAVPMSAAHEIGASRLPHPHCGGRSHHSGIGAAPDPVGSEQLACHEFPCPVPMARLSRASGAVIAQGRRSAHGRTGFCCKTTHRPSEGCAGNDPPAGGADLCRAGRRVGAGHGSGEPGPAAMDRTGRPAGPEPCGCVRFEMTIIPLVAALLVLGLAHDGHAARAGRVARVFLALVAAVLVASGSFATIAMPLLLDVFPDSRQRQPVSGRGARTDRRRCRASSISLAG